MLHCDFLEVFTYFCSVWKFVLQELETHKKVGLCLKILQVKQMEYKGRKDVFYLFLLAFFIILFSLFCCFM